MKKMVKGFLLAVSAAVICVCASCSADIAETGGAVGGTISRSEKTAVNNTDNWELILVNKDNPLPEGYEIELCELSNGRSVDRRIYPDLQEMFDAARSDGLSIEVTEGYRTREQQQEMMDDKIRELRWHGNSKKKATKRAAELVAQPGTSEHELGLAVDINPVSDDEDPWPLYTWLADNAADYGFILRYPLDCQDITGIDYEPWHYRYVGKEAADEIMSKGITLEEYLTQK